MNYLLSAMKSVLSNLIEINTEELEKAPIKDKSVEKDIRTSYLKSFMTIVTAFRFLNLSTNYLNWAADDSYRNLTILRMLNGDKQEMLVILKDKSKVQGNLDLLLDLFSIIMQKSNLKKIWDMYDCLVQTLG